MDLESLARELAADDEPTRNAMDLVEVEDSFDAPMMIMNQIHEA